MPAALDRVTRLHVINEKIDTVCFDYPDDERNGRQSRLISPFTAGLVGTTAGLYGIGSMAKPPAIGQFQPGGLGKTLGQTASAAVNQAKNIGKGGLTEAARTIATGASVAGSTAKKAASPILAKILARAKGAFHMSSRHEKLVNLNSKMESLVELESPYSEYRQTEKSVHAGAQSKLNEAKKDYRTAKGKYHLTINPFVNKKLAMAHQKLADESYLGPGGLIGAATGATAGAAAGAKFAKVPGALLGGFYGTILGGSGGLLAGAHVRRDKPLNRWDEKRYNEVKSAFFSTHGKLIQLNSKMDEVIELGNPPSRGPAGVDPSRGQFGGNDPGILGQIAKDNKESSARQQLKLKINRLKSMGLLK